MKKVLFYTDNNGLLPKQIYFDHNYGHRQCLPIGGAAVAMKPHQALRRLLVHPKDKRSPQDTASVIYQIPCKDCTKVYTGETGRKYGIREKEHRKDVESIASQKFTRSRKKDSVSDYHPSALTDHVAQQNHTIDWDKVTLPMKETDWHVHGIKEAIQIRKSGKDSLNRDGGRHQLSSLYNHLLVAPPTGKH